MSEAFTWDQSQFNRTLRDYLGVTSRTIPEAINTKGFFIARRAVAETPAAEKDAIRAYGKTGAIIGRLINKRRGARGEKGLYGKAMATEVKTVIAARLRSRAYLKSGWIPAIKTFEKVIEAKWRRGAAKPDTAAKQVGKPKGKASPARPGFKVVAALENAIGLEGKRTGKQNAALMKFGGPALARAFDFETASMMKYLDDRMKPDAKKFNDAQR